ADIYSFGVMLYQMIKGELPFTGDSWETLERLHKTQNPPYLTETHPRLADLIQSCLAKKTTDRPANFALVREILAGIYIKIAKSDPPEAARGSALTAAQWSNKGSSLDNLGKRAEAIACYEIALRLNPHSAPTWFNKGVALF